MMKINTIIKALKKYEKVTDYAIKEVHTTTYEQFYDLQKLETKRMTNTNEINVRVYSRFEENGNKYLGNASFIISHKLTSKELNKLIEDAIYQASFVKNEYYEIVEGGAKKTFTQKALAKGPYETLEDVAHIFFDEKTDECMFNSLECFYNENEIHLVNSKGINYKKKIHNIQVEAIPSYKKKGDIRLNATELYRMFKYDEFDSAKIKEDAHNAILDILNRSNAQKLEENKTINVILKDKHILEMMDELISSYDYASVYSHTNYKNLGDSIQNEPTQALNISIAPASKADFFDEDGVLLKETKIIDNGIVKSYYGSNRYAYYLKIKPSGYMSTINLECGNTKYTQMKKKPYVEILDVSGIQVDLFGDYIGGEVRLANYFDGKKTSSLTAFSFSGSLQKCIDSLELSKEKSKINYYNGPKYALLKDLEIL